MRRDSPASPSSFYLSALVSKLIAVHRVLALLLVPALIATSGVSFALHTHIYTDHEHQHRLSAHHHDGTLTREAEGTARLDKCDPAQHTVSFAVACAAPPQHHAVDAEVGPPHR
jgi:hypothetical protein